MIQNLLQYLLPLIILGMPALSWIIQKLRENYQTKQLKDAERQSREDALRQSAPVTTRSQTPPEEDPLEKRRRELAARRAEQLRQLRERQEQRTGAVVLQPQQTQSPRTMPTATGAPGSPARPPAGRQQRPGLPAQRPPVRRPQPQPSQRTPQQRQRTGRQLPRATSPTRPQDAPQQSNRIQLASALQTEIGQGAPTETDPSSSRSHPLLRSGSGTDLRRAIMLSEIFGKPMSMRTTIEEPWSGR